MSFTREQTNSLDVETTQQEDVAQQSGNQKNAMSNSQVLEQLMGEKPKDSNIDVSSAQDGPSFAKAASKALDAVVPGPGSSASLKISGKLPVYTTGAINAYLMPALSLSALRMSSGKLKVTIDSELGLRAEAGTSGGSWWPKFLAYFQGKLKGTIRIVGDDAAEIFNELLLTFRLVLEQACSAAGASEDMTEKIAGSIMSGSSKESTIENMDDGDYVETLIGGEVEAGTDTSFGSAKAKATLQNSTKVSKNEEEGDLQVTNYNRSTVAVDTTVKIPKLGASSTVGVNLIFKDGVFDEFWVSANLSKSMALGDFSAEVLMAVDWIQEFVNSMSNALAMGNLKSQTSVRNSSDITQVANMLRGISVAENAIQYTAFGEGLKSAAGSSLFQQHSGQKISMEIAGRAGWSKSKGVNMLVWLKSSSGWSLGKAGESPIQIDVSTGDTILQFSAGTEKGTSLTSGW